MLKFWMPAINFLRFKGITNPEEKREAITQTFYRDVSGNAYGRARQGISFGNNTYGH